VCCSVLQCVAVCCSVLQCVAVCCRVLQCVAVCCSVCAFVDAWWLTPSLKCVHVYCSVRAVMYACWLAPKNSLWARPSCGSTTYKCMNGSAIYIHVYTYLCMNTYMCTLMYNFDLINPQLVRELACNLIQLHLYVFIDIKVHLVYA